MIATVFDTETTSLMENRVLRLNKQPEIIDFYACTVDLRTGELMKAYETLIKPSQPIDPEITKITGLTEAALADAPMWKDIYPSVIDILQGAPAVIAHNASFDTEVIEIEMERIGQNIKWSELICTVEQTIHIKGHRLSLTALHEYLFDEPFKDAHRAKPDTQALVRCCCELYKRGML